MKILVDRGLNDIILVSFILMAWNAPLFQSQTQDTGNMNLEYDYFATTECFKEPLPPQYKGGIIKHMRSVNVTNVSQTIQLKDGLYYVFSAWVQMSEGSDEKVIAAFEYPTGVTIKAGSVVAKTGCWSMIKGGIIANLTIPAHIIFEEKNSSKVIWADNISLQPFTEEQWRSHQNQSIHKVRKTKINLEVYDVTDVNKRISGAKVIINHAKSHFPLGCSMSKNIVNNLAYQNWFASRFKVTTFRNEMKWYDNEPTQGQENYANPDYMVNFTQQYGISIRGHNIFWDDPKYQPQWVYGLNADQLRDATNRRINSLVSRYRGRVIHWDVVNENLHFSFFEGKLGPDFSGGSYAQAHQLDGGATLFMNEYNTVEDGRDGSSLPQNYINKLRSLQGSIGGAPIGIGLESHFHDQPNIVYMRSTLDILASTRMPIWLTEVDVVSNTNQAEFLEQILREGYAHPAVQGIVMWSGPAIEGYDMTLIDNNFRNTPAGDVVDKLLNEWRFGVQELTTDDNGVIEVSLFHGDYDLAVVHPSTNSTTKYSIKANSADESLYIHIHV